MFQLFVLLFIIKLYARSNIFKSINVIHKKNIPPTDLAQSHCNNVITILCISLWIFSHLPKKLQKVGMKLLG